MPTRHTDAPLDLVGSTTVDEDLAGLDALEDLPGERQRSFGSLWAGLWPKMAALGIALGSWQAVVWSGWKPKYVLPGPAKVFSELWGLLLDGTIADAAVLTLTRAVKGYLLALVIGVLVGSLVSRNRRLRAAFGSLITGLQLMPSIVWLPFAVLIFKISEGAILFVVVLGAAPSIANGLISGADHIPPVLLRAGRVLGARGFASFRYIILPGSMPGFAAGLKQGWAFAWRSLMAGELIVIVAGHQSIGTLIQNYRTLNDITAVMAVMVVILVIGIVIDALVFNQIERRVRRRWGLESS